MNIRDCFKEDFTGWLLKSNNPKVGPYLGEDRFKDMLTQVEEESLSEILDILLREPLADHFWYTYPEQGLSGPKVSSSRLIYSLPDHQLVPSDSLRVDGDKVKSFLRDYKIESILNK